MKRTLSIIEYFAIECLRLELIADLKTLLDNPKIFTQDRIRTLVLMLQDHKQVEPDKFMPVAKLLAYSKRVSVNDINLKFKKLIGWGELPQEPKQNKGLAVFDGAIW